MPVFGNNPANWKRGYSTKTDKMVLRLIETWVFLFFSNSDIYFPLYFSKHLFLFDGPEGLYIYKTKVRLLKIKIFLSPTGTLANVSFQWVFFSLFTLIKNKKR